MKDVTEMTDEELRAEYVEAKRDFSQALFRELLCEEIRKLRLQVDARELEILYLRRQPEEQRG